jgi:ABC-type glycerol-3-phosphate transport system permease component
MTVGSLAMIAPFVWMVLASFKSLSETGDPGWMPRTGWHWANYAEVFRVIPFLRFSANSVVVAGWVTLIQVMTSAMAAFSFSRLEWPGRDRVFFLYLGTMMLPGLVMVISNFQIMVRFGMVDSYLGLVLPSAFGAFGTFLLRQFMLGIPRALDEAAEMDGAGKWRIFWDVILPLSRPGLVTLAIFTFMGNYQSFFWPVVMMKTVEKYTLPVGLLFFDSKHGQATHLLMAAVTMSVVPLIILFVMLQRQLIRGIQLGAVKG